MKRSRPIFIIMDYNNSNSSLGFILPQPCVCRSWRLCWVWTWAAVRAPFMRARLPWWTSCCVSAADLCCLTPDDFHRQALYDVTTPIDSVTNASPQTCFADAGIVQGARQAPPPTTVEQALHTSSTQQLRTPTSNDVNRICDIQLFSNIGRYIPDFSKYIYIENTCPYYYPRKRYMIFFVLFLEEFDQGNPIACWLVLFEKKTILKEWTENVSQSFYWIILNSSHI